VEKIKGLPIYSKISPPSATGKVTGLAAADGSWIGLEKRQKKSPYDNGDPDILNKI
jgi:hypothetical protein